MLKITESKIIEGIHNLRKYYRFSDLEAPYIEILEGSDWQSDGTGRGLVAQYNNKRYYVLYSRITLTPFNKAGDWVAHTDITLKVNSKYNDELFSHRVNLSLNGDLL